MQLRLKNNNYLNLGEYIVSTNTAINPMGLKRICTSCGGRFYDLNKRPISCPECDTEFTGEVKAKTRRGRVAAEPEKEIIKEVEHKKDEGEIIEEDSEVEVVSLDDAEASTKEEDDDDTVLGEDTLDDIPDLAASDADETGDEDILLDDEA